MGRGDRHDRVKELVFAASRLPRSRRSAFLEYAAAGDGALLAEVMSLLPRIDAGDGPSPAPELASPPTLHPGALLMGRYRIGMELGRGRFGAVLRAHDEVLGHPVAIKCAVRRDPSEREQLLREARLARSIQHPNVRRIHDVIASGRQVHLVMELVEGRDLERRLQTEGAIPAAEVAALALDIASGLAALHSAGITHGDLKPENVIVRDSGTALITDLGVAFHEADAASGTTLGGTPRYLSPERRAGAPASPSADVYALALLLSELLVGRSEEMADVHEYAIDLVTIVPDMDPALAAAIEQGLLPEPSRPANGAEFIDLLRGRHRDARSNPIAVRRVVTALLCNFRGDDRFEILGLRQRGLEIARKYGGAAVESWTVKRLLVLFGPTGRGDRHGVRALRAGLEMAGQLRTARTSSPCVALETRSVDVLFEGPGVPLLDDAFDWLTGAAEAGRAGSVVISEGTRTSIGERFALLPIDGGEGGYEVLSERRPRSIDVALRSGRANAAGRGAEKQRILARWQEVRSTGRGSVVAVHGPPGIGKTRLIGEVAVGLGESCRWVEVACPGEQAAPLEPWRWAIEEILGERIPPAGLADYLLGPDASAMDPWVRQACVADALLKKLAAHEASDPIVLVFEDLQSCDPASRHALATIAERAEELPMLLIVSWNDASSFEAAPSWEHVELGPLEPIDAEAMLGDLLGADHPLSKTLVERSLGVPFYVEQLALAVRRGAAVGSIPATIHEVLASRLERLGEHLRVALAAAVVGTEFDASTLARAVEMDGPALDRAIDAMIADEWIEHVASTDRRTFRFRHSLLHQSAYELIPHELRSRLHESCMAAIRADDAISDIDRLLAFARHSEGAGRDEDAVTWWVEAARYVEARSQHLSAVDYLRRALALGPEKGREIEIRFALLKLQQTTLAYSLRDTRENAERVLELLGGAATTEAELRPLYLLGRSHLAAADLRMKEFGTRIALLAEQSLDPSLRCVFSTQCGNLDLVQGRLETGRLWYLRGLQAAHAIDPGSVSRIDPPAPEIIAYAGLALLESLQCRADWRGYAGRISSCRQDSFDEASRCYGLVHLSQTYLLRGELDVAAALAVEGEALAAENRMDVYSAFAGLVRSCASTRLPDPAPAADAIRARLRELAALDWRLFEAFALSHLADAEMRRGNRAAAREAVERGIGLGATRLDGIWLAELHRQLAELRAASGEATADVVAEYQRAIRIARHQGAVAFELRATTSLLGWHPGARGRAHARAALASLVDRPGLDPAAPDLVRAREILAAHSAPG